MSPERVAISLHASLVTMRGIALIESRGWNGAAAKLAVDTTGLGPYAVWNDFSVGYAAVERGDMAQALRASTDLHAWREKTSNSETHPLFPGMLAIMDDDLRGIVLIHQRRVAEGLTAIRQAAYHYDSMAFMFGPPMPLKPPHELLREQLLQSGKSAQAIAEFEAAFKKAPNRSLSLLGLARAQAAAHDAKAAAATYRTLLANWHAADAGLPGMSEARDYLAK